RLDIGCQGIHSRSSVARRWQRRWHCSRWSGPAIREGEINAYQRSGRLAYQRFDARAKAIFHPLEDETVGGRKFEPSGIVRAGKRTDPSRKLLRRELLLKGGETGGPSRRC